jgi:hypothetical protein
MIYGTEHFVRPAQAHAPTLAVILNLFQDLSKKYTDAETLKKILQPS